MSEVKRHDEGGESPEKPIRYEDIMRQLQDSAMMEKPFDFSSREYVLEHAVKKGLITQEDANSFLNSKGDMGGRGMCHTFRMLKRSGAEKEFALAYTQRNLGNLFGKEEQDLQGKIRKVIEHEGYDTMNFWTFAPYLFKALKEKGLTEDRAMRLVLEWGGTGKFSSYLKEGEPWINLKGLEWLNQYHDKYKSSYVLSDNPNHVSHKFTEQEARRIADLLLAENEK